MHRHSLIVDMWLPAKQQVLQLTGCTTSRDELWSSQGAATSRASQVLLTVLPAQTHAQLDPVPPLQSVLVTSKQKSASHKLIQDRTSVAMS